MSSSPSDTAPEDRTFFRCPVVTERSEAKLKVGGRKIDATVLEASIVGYTIVVDAQHHSRLRRDKSEWVISYDETKAIVKAESVAEPKDGKCRIGLLQIEDLTKPERIKSAFWSRFLPARDPNGDHAAIAYGGFVLFLFAAMALPGFGDKLGTSNKIQNTIRWVVDGAGQQFDTWLR
jgi:hypothetical protein